MYLPQTYQFETTPLLAEEHLAALTEILARIDATIVQRGQAYWQPGKRVCHTLFAHLPHTIADFTAEVQAIAADVSADFAVVPAVLALNIYPAHINKGSGLQWLADVTGIEPAEMAGVGDSSSDVDFLRLVGYPAAPVNATSDVKAVANFVANRSDALGVLDMLELWEL
jgi:hydroxymethylpyrimidine pyrophosphatase-like HAD family hydrolase